MTSAVGTQVSSGRGNGTVVLLGEHAVVYGMPAIAAGIGLGATARASASAAFGIRIAELRASSGDGSELVAALERNNSNVGAGYGVERIKPILGEGPRAGSDGPVAITWRSWREPGAPGEFREASQEFAHAQTGEVPQVVCGPPGRAGWSTRGGGLAALRSGLDLAGGAADLLALAGRAMTSAEPLQLVLARTGRQRLLLVRLRALLQGLLGTSHFSHLRMNG